MDEITVRITNSEALERATKVFNSHLEEIALSIKQALAKENISKGAIHEQFSKNQ